MAQCVMTAEGGQSSLLDAALCECWPSGVGLQGRPRQVPAERLLAETTEWLTVGSTEVDLSVSGDDTSDALVAQMVARAETVGLMEDDRSAGGRGRGTAMPRDGTLDPRPVT